MLNAPGTILLVRSMIKQKTRWNTKKTVSPSPSFVVVQTKKITKRKKIPNCSPFHQYDEWGKQFILDIENINLIPYGDSCLMLNYEPAFKAEKIGINSNLVNLMCLQLFWNNKIVYCYGTKSSLKKRFTFPNTWNHNKHPEKLKRFKENGSYQKLIDLCELQNKK